MPNGACLVVSSCTNKKRTLKTYGSDHHRLFGSQHGDGYGRLHQARAGVIGDEQGLGR